ncbi:hypothetical protein Nepgr_030967 [Nepenthes gracilis]|uniref:Uncharacterized protein n=1 Tax=Nepenthes gracilis TaxID=150966 RepID=A0AAD3TH66_NEPGR|nr:hypothetical protein Nepgr_030967 [Nepenthes gracilis]
MAAHEINHSYDDPMVMVVENIAYPNTYDRMHASYRSEGNAENSTILQNTAESIAVESNERETRGLSLHSTVAEGKLETCYEVPVLVPGLIPCFEMETKDVSREDGLKCDFDTSAYADNAVPEIDQGNRNELPPNEEKNESGIDDGNPQNEVLTEAVIDHGRKPCDVEPVREATNLRKDEDPNEVLTEAVIDDGLKPCDDEPGRENTNSREDEDPNDSNSVQNTLLKNDINWSQKTLKKLLNRLRFL